MPRRTHLLRRRTTAYSGCENHMTPEWLTAIATAGTFIVIAASAVAAIFQLRHMRGSNQITALTECRERLESREFQDARQFIRSEEFRSLLKDGAVQHSLREGTLPMSLYKARYIANFFESFVRSQRDHRQEDRMRSLVASYLRLLAIASPYDSNHSRAPSRRLGEF